MPKMTKICRVCGNSYEACHTARTGSSTFRWQEVACSPECGAEYLKRIQASRAKTAYVATPVAKETAKVAAAAVETTQIPFTVHLTATPPAAVVAEEPEKQEEVSETEVAESAPVEDDSQDDE